ncbi:MAG: bifunctional folylpolyglutamate synthase/dihydrofolate synthase [Schleiferiaceae bacterium]|nr:bifunctional folylpolyglutamate synthase/dihydrofolate synthase [Schleiferiaceae bacterium]
MSRYHETLEWLYAQLPVFQHSGGQLSSYKLDLSKTQSFMEVLGNPERNFPAFHVAGTNGKGSTSHMLASCLQEGGYCVGLYTSPHLVSYTERIKIQGQELSEEAVVHFVDQWKSQFINLELSFFEMSVGMAFQAFADAKVDVAVIEVGMGGRLDSTNVIESIVTGVTTIDLDHQAFLGDSRALIAREKAGIFKPSIPAVVGQRDPETEPVFLEHAAKTGCPLVWAEDYPFALSSCDLLGNYQESNQRVARAMLAAQKHFLLSEATIQAGLQKVVYNTGLQGRWQIVQEGPLAIFDTAHNPQGLRATMSQFTQLEGGLMHLVIGMVGDKDVSAALGCLPKEARYYFCAPRIPRALAVHEIQAKSETLGLHGMAYNSVAEAWEAALSAASKDDRIYLGGSTFVVADALTYLK